MRIRLVLLAVLAVIVAVLMPTPAFASTPTASLSVSPDPATSGQYVSVYGYNSCCNIVNYNFDFGDGHSISQTSPYAYHYYYNYGSSQAAYTVRMTVTDNTGATNSTTATEYVSPDLAPVARLTVSDNTSDASGLSIYADASASTDADPSAYSPPYYYEFNFGDGTSGSAYYSGVVGHKYSAGGTYTVQVRVYDTEWNSDANSTTAVTVTVPSTCGGVPCTSIPNAPSATKLKMILPSTVFKGGAFPIQVLVTPPATSPVPICSYQIDRGANAVWTTVSTQASTSYNSPALSPSSGVNQYRAWSVGCNGHKSLKATGSTTFLPIMFDDRSFAYAGKWSLVNDRNAFGRRYEKSTTLGASATFQGVVNNIGVVAQTMPSGGTISVYVDGVLKGTANLYSATLRERQIVFKWGTKPPVATHTIKIVLTGTGTGGGKTVALDGLAAIGG